VHECMHRCDSPGARHILSYGGGINSTALLVLLIKQGYPLDEVVFADTGGEVPETYQYVKTISRYLRGKGVPFRIVRSVVGKLYDTCERRKVVPSEIWRWCTRDYKITPIYGYYRSFNSNIHQYLGIAYDETDRMKDSKAPYILNVYPLIDEKLGRRDCVDIIREAGLPLPVRSGCYFCPFNSLDRWEEIYRGHPDLFAKALKLEESNKHFPKQKLADATLGKLQLKLRNHEPPQQVRHDSPCGSECFT
jgi:hypothetical protein